MVDARGSDDSFLVLRESDLAAARFLFHLSKGHVMFITKALILHNMRDFVDIILCFGSLFEMFLRFANPPLLLPDHLLDPSFLPPFSLIHIYAAFPIDRNS